MIDLSVILVSWNTREHLKECLGSLYREKKNISCEVFVVDNASTDGSREMIRSNYPQVVLIENHSNVGFAKANNQALRKCSGKYVLLLNPDTEVLRSCLENMLDFMEKHPDAGAAGCRILNSKGELEPFRTAKRFPTPLTKFFVDMHMDRLLPKIKLLGQYSMVGWDRSDTREVDVLSGAFMFIRREVILDVGLLDERFFLLAEDIDWCWRIKHKNWKILFNPHAEIIHHAGKAIDQVPFVRLKNAILSHLLYFEKYHKRYDVVVFRFLQSITHVSKAVFWLCKFLSGKKPIYAWKNSKAHFKAFYYCFAART